MAIFASIKTDMQGQIFILEIPCYYELSGTFGCGVEGVMTNVDMQTFLPAMSDAFLNGSFQLEIGGGVGIAKVITFGAKGSGKLSTKSSIFDDYFKVDVNATAKLEAKVLGKNVFNKPFLSGNILIYETGNPDGLLNKKTKQKAFSTYELYAAIDSEEIYDDAFGNYSDENGSEWIRSYISNGHKELTRLASNVYTDSEPQICEVDDKLIMVTTWYNKTREIITNDGCTNTLNCPMLVYSIYDEKIKDWTAPIPVCDDGTADYYPVFKNGTLVWHNFKDVLTNNAVTLSQIASNGEICVSKWNGAGFTTTTLTNDTTLDTTPSVSADGTTVAWISNNSNNILFTRGNTSIKKSVFNGEYWSESEMVVDNLPPIICMDVDNINAETYIVYITDNDNDFDTFDDRTLTVYNKTQTKVVKDAGKSISNPVILNGKIYWYSDKNIKYSDIDGNNVQTVFSSQQKELSDKFRVCESNQNSVILFSDFNEKSSLGMILYDNGEWSNIIKFTDISDSVNKPSGILRTDGSMVLAFNTEEWERAEGIPTLKNTNLCTYVLIPTYDIEITDVSCEEDKITSNSKNELMVTVKNSGEKTIENYNLTTSSPDGKTINTIRITSRIKPGETKTISTPIAITANGTTGDWLVTATLSEEEEITDNNSFKINIGKPDIEIKTDYIIESEDKYIVGVYISNIGNLDADNIKLSAYNKDILLSNTVIDSLIVGGVAFLELEIDKNTIDFNDETEKIVINASIEQEEIYM